MKKLLAFLTLVFLSIFSDAEESIALDPKLSYISCNLSEDLKYCMDGLTKRELDEYLVHKVIKPVVVKTRTIKYLPTGKGEGYQAIMIFGYLEK